MKKLEYNTIKEKLKDIYNVELLSKAYKNSDQKLIYKDKNGYLYYSSWTNLSSGKMASFADKRNIFVMRNLRRYIKINNLDVELLSEKYEKNLRFRCKCGKTYKRSWDNFKRKGCLCPKCALKVRNENHRNNMDFMNNLFIANGYKINSNAYTSTKNVDCYDKDSYRGLFSYHRLQ